MLLRPSVVEYSLSGKNIVANFLEYQQDGAVVTLTMNRPESRNAISDNVFFNVEEPDTCLTL